MVGAQVPGLAGEAASATARVGIRALADDDLTLQIDGLVGSQELEGLEGEAGNATSA